ncbi:MAG: amino acid ABC transporter substrate-binding protein [Chloroflexi bacterium]|nr:MAG: amino acid ABC transporter substrate-binding protein [Chloroflexota bacterium]
MFNKRLLALAVTVAIIGIVWWLWPRDDGTLAEIRRRGTLRVGLDASFPPFENIDADGQISGLDVDIARAVAADLGVQAQLVNIGFDGLYDALLARRVDVVISGLPVDPRRTQDVAYTRNYFNAGQMLVAPANNPDITRTADLTGRTVAVEWGSQADMEARRLAEQIPGITLVRRETAAAALEAAHSGAADAAIVDGVSAAGAAALGLRPVEQLTDEWYAAAVHIESRELLDAVNQTLTRLEDNGQMAQIRARWLANSK